MDVHYIKTNLKKIFATIKETKKKWTKFLRTEREGVDSNKDVVNLKR